MVGLKGRYRNHIKCKPILCINILFGNKLKFPQICLPPTNHAKLRQKFLALM